MGDEVPEEDASTTSAPDSQLEKDIADPAMYPTDTAMDEGGEDIIVGDDGNRDDPDEDWNGAPAGEWADKCC